MPGINTRRLLVEEGGFLYDSDAYNDDLPWWSREFGRPHLVLPMTLDNNDTRFARDRAYDQAESFFSYLRGTLDCLRREDFFRTLVDAFEVLWKEGADRPKMMSVGLHGRVIGLPGRIAGLERFLDHASGCDDVWICRREDIARFWTQRHPP